MLYFFCSIPQHFAYFPICCGCFLAFLVVAYPDISFLTFFGVHFRFTHTLCFIFSLLFMWLCTPLFHFLYFSGYAPPHTSLIVASAHSYSPKTYPNIFIFNISRGTLLNCLTYFPPPLCTKGYRVALASTRYPSTNSLTFYIHISIYQYSHFYISIFILTACLFASPLAYGYFFASMNIFPIYAVIFIYEYLPHLCCHFYICTYS